MSSITADEFSLLSKYIYAICGVALEASKTYLVETRLKNMMQQYGCATYMDLYNKTKADRGGSMEKEIVNAITTNETLFFRDASPFEVFKHKILPDLIDARAKSNPGRPVPIRIWSAACSTGQEVYSIAIALRETLGSLSNYHLTILGTDISDDAVAKASYGKYNKFEIERGLPPQTLNKYFNLMGDGWKIKDEIRAMAVFKKFNLMKPFAGLGRFDVVFCRNVAIYFTPSDKKMVFEKIAGVLESDGSLIIGSTESLTGVTSVFEAKRYMRSVFYQVTNGASQPMAAPPAPAFAARSTAPSPQPRAPLPPPRPVPAAAPTGIPRATPGGPPTNAAPRPAPPSVPVSEPPRPAPSVQAPAFEPLAVIQEESQASESASRPAPRSAPMRSMPAPTNRAGDKSSLKRLIMQKKQQAKA
jgi:chemotaxis protein methyltransferase CheR